MEFQSDDMEYTKEKGHSTGKTGLCILPLDMLGKSSRQLDKWLDRTARG